MDLLQKAKDRLEGKNLSEVARRGDFAYGTIQRLATNKSEDIYVGTYVRLMRVLDEMEAERNA